MSEIKKINNFKELLLELLQNTVNIISKPKTNQILSNRTKTFIQEYHKLNNISISTTCSVKTDREYKTGKLILNNNKLVILQYQSNKKNQNYNLNTIIQTVDILNPIFFIDFNMATSELVIHKTKQKFRLVILGKNMKNHDFDNNDDYIYKYRIVKFKMPYESSEVFKLICENINKSIILSDGYKHNIFGINIRNHFCNEYFIDYKKFESIGNTGDILLFKGYSNESKFQRFITDNGYDHVGLFIKNKNGLHLYEATGKEGVKLRPWNEFITYYWYLLYDKMAHRKLNVDENAMKLFISENEEEEEINGNNIFKSLKDKFYYYFNKKTEDFLDKTKDKKYHFSKKGYFCQSKMKKSIIRESYSCSELIGAYYYYLGIVTDEMEAYNYLPGHFSRTGIINFKKGYSLGQEYIIDFSSS
jgi:hypothetical protein